MTLALHQRHAPQAQFAHSHADSQRYRLHRHDDLGYHDSFLSGLPVSDRVLIDVENEPGARPDDLDLPDSRNEHVLNGHWFHEGRGWNWRLSAHGQPSVVADSTLQRGLFARDERGPKNLTQFQSGLPRPVSAFPTQTRPAGSSPVASQKAGRTYSRSARSASRADAPGRAQTIAGTLSRIARVSGLAPRRSFSRSHATELA